MSARITRTLGATTLKKYKKLSSILKYIFVDICGIDQTKYYQLGSFAIRKYRNINDLDINLDRDEFMKLKQATRHWKNYYRNLVSSEVTKLIRSEQNREQTTEPRYPIIN